MLKLLLQPAIILNCGACRERKFS